ncbi:MAG: thioredoxin domain-containing protein [Geovibrio sp.]|nr:thioredoxin domain-containing protein [Geovibrio sp.]
MKKSILAVLLLVSLAACGAQKETAKPEADVSAVMKENLGKFFTSKNMNDVTYEVEVIEPVEGVEALKFVKLTFKDAERSQEQYVFTDGKYIIPDITEVATGTGIKDKLVFKNTPPANIDLSKLTLAYGNKDAKNYIVEVSDFQCPYCRRTHEYLKEKLAGKDVAIYFMHFPLAFHPKAELYARVFEAGMAQNANFYDDLYSTTPDFDAKTDAEIIDFFAAKTADAAAFKALVNDNATVGKVAEQMQAAQAMGVSGTPALYFNGKLIGGFKPPMFDLAIETFK